MCAWCLLLSCSRFIYFLVVVVVVAKILNGNPSQQQQQQRETTVHGSCAFVYVCVFVFGAREWRFWGFEEKRSSIQAEEVCLWGLPSFLPLLKLELFLGLDVFSLSDPSCGLLLLLFFKSFFLCNLSFFNSVVFHTPSALGSWILAFVFFFMWMDGFCVLKMWALFVGFTVCGYFHVVGFFQGLMLLWIWIWEFFCLFWISRSCCTSMWIAFAGLGVKN